MTGMELKPGWDAPVYNDSFEDDPERFWSTVEHACASADNGKEQQR